jgi:hypothetical protein
VAGARRARLHSGLPRHAVPRMRLLSTTALALLLVHALPAAAVEHQACTASVLGLLGRELKVAHFASPPDDGGKDPAGVVRASACKHAPDDPRLTLAAVAWDEHQEDAKALVVAVVDESGAKVDALLRDVIDEDATTQVRDGSLRLDTAPYQLAPGVRAFGLDIAGGNDNCGDGGFGPMRTLYVREGPALRSVLGGLYVSEFTWLRGNQPRCVADQREADTAILEARDVTLALGGAGKSGWRDLLLTVTASRSDHKPARKPLHVTVPYDGSAYDLKAFDAASRRWSK